MDLSFDDMGVQEALVMFPIPKNVMSPRPIKRRGKHIPAKAIPGTNCQSQKSHIHTEIARETSAHRYRARAKLSEDMAIARIAQKHKGTMTIACYGMLDVYVLMGIVTFVNDSAIWQSYSPVTCTLESPKVISGRSSFVTEDDIRKHAGLDSYDRVRTLRIA